MTRLQHAPKLECVVTDRRRTGSSLVELLAALPLMAIATGIAMLLLVRSASDHRLTANGQRTVRELRQARHLLNAEIAPLAGRDVIAWRDSLLSLRVHQGVAQLCGTSGTTLEVAAAPGDLAPVWMDGVRAGDLIRWWHTPDTPDAPATEDSAVVADAPSRLAVGPCGAAPRERRWRVTLTASAANGWTGSPVVVRREVQYVHYRSGGQWWLGRRTRDLSGWDVVQPVFGPLDTPARGGMRIGAHSASGIATSTPDSVALLTFGLRVPVPAFAQRDSSRVTHVADSTRVEIALRGDAWARGRP